MPETFLGRSSVFIGLCWFLLKRFLRFMNWKCLKEQGFQQNSQVYRCIPPPVRAEYARFYGPGRSVAWLARVVRVHEVVSSNLTAPTINSLCLYSNFSESPREDCAIPEKALKKLKRLNIKCLGKRRALFSGLRNFKKTDTDQELPCSQRVGKDTRGVSKGLRTGSKPPCAWSSENDVWRHGEFFGGDAQRRPNTRFH